MRKKCELENDYNPKWLDMVSSCLANIGMNDVWIMQGNGFTTDYVNLAVKRRLKYIYLQQWYEDKQKNNFCNTIKDEWNLEYYLTKLNCFQRKILSKFRCRSNYLPVSQIKFYQNEDDWEDCLLCPFCRDDSVGDEFHYLFQCSFFNDERVKYIKEVYLQHPDEYTLISVLNSRNKGILSKLVEFIDLIISAHVLGVQMVRWLGIGASSSLAQYIICIYLGKFALCYVVFVDVFCTCFSLNDLYLVCCLCTYIFV